MNRLLTFMLLLLLAAVSQAEIYKWTDEGGRTHFSDLKPAHLEVSPLQLKVNTYQSVSYQKSSPDFGTQKVVMYSTDWCIYCEKARRYFREKSISFVEYDIEKNRAASAQYKNLGATGVPVIVVGKQRMNGFSEKGFEKIYH